MPCGAIHDDLARDHYLTARGGAQLIGSSGKRPGAICRLCVPNSDRGANNNGHANVGRDVFL
jgi:hypothetical protein